MKTVASTMTILTVLLTLTANLAVGQEQDTGSEELGISSSMAGQLMFIQPTRYEGWIFFDRVFASDDSRNSVQGKFVLNGQLEVEYLTVDGQVLHNDPDNPLPGLPQNAEGAVRDMHILLDGYKYHKRVVYGRAYLKTLKPGDGIEIEMQPVRQDKFLEYDLPPEIDPDDLEVRINGLRAGDYDSNLGGFHFRIDPMRVGEEAAFEVYDQSTGQVLFTGTVSPNSDPVIDPQHTVNLKYLGGVKRVDLVNNTSKDFVDQDLVGWDRLEDGTKVPALAFMVHQKESAQGFVRFDKNFEGEFQAFVWQKEGQMESCPLRQGWADTVFYLPKEERLVVVVYGQRGQDFSITFSQGGKG